MVVRSSRQQLMLRLSGARGRFKAARAPRRFRFGGGRSGGGGATMTFQRHPRGGFFKSIGKAIGKIAKIPVIGAIAKTVVGSIPVLGTAVSVVAAVKGAVTTDRKSVV